MKYFNHIGSVTLKKINTRDISITLGLKNPLAICNYFIDYRNYFVNLKTIAQFHYMICHSLSRLGRDFQLNLSF